MRPVPAENDKPSLVTGVFLKNVAWRLYKSISEFALFRVLHNALRLADFHRSSMPKIVVFLGNIGSHERCWQGPERIISLQMPFTKASRRCSRRCIGPQLRLRLGRHGQTLVLNQNAGDPPQAAKLQTRTKT